MGYAKKPAAGRLMQGAAPLSEGSARQPERLVGRCFRLGMATLATGDVLPMELAWQELADAAGADAADPLACDLSCFIEAVGASAARRIETLPAGCPGFCRDECLAISIIAASQHGACPALKACAFALLASSRVETVLTRAEHFARRLKGAGQRLACNSVCNAAALVDPSLHHRN